MDIVSQSKGVIQIPINNFGEILRSLRQDKRVSQTDISAILGITLRGLRRYEAGELEPDIDALIALADFFEVSLDELVGRDWKKV